MHRVDHTNDERYNDVHDQNDLKQKCIPSKGKEVISRFKWRESKIQEWTSKDFTVVQRSLFVDFREVPKVVKYKVYNGSRFR